MSEWTQEEQEYMDYLDDLAELPTNHSFGLLLAKGDPTAFQVGFEEWLHVQEWKAQVPKS